MNDQQIEQAIARYCLIKQAIAELEEQVRNNPNNKILKRQLDRLKKVELKSAQGQLLSIFNQLKLVKPRVTGFEKEYQSLLGLVQTEFLNKICSEFQPVQGQSLEKSLSNWVNYKLRLRFRIIELIEEQIQDIPLENLIREITADTTEEERCGYAIRVYQNILEDPEQKLRNLPPNQDQKNYNCHYLMLGYFAVGDNQDKFMSEMARQLGVNRQTLQSDWERHCLPCMYQMMLDLVENQEQLKTYIETDPDGKLTSLKFQNSVECNCQALSLRLLPLFTDKPPGFTELAREYKLPTQTEQIKRFWKLECLLKLTQIAYQLECY